jgi:hypothetical protein
MPRAVAYKSRGFEGAPEREGATGGDAAGGKRPRVEAAAGGGAAAGRQQPGSGGPGAQGGGAAAPPPDRASAIKALADGMAASSGGAAKVDLAAPDVTLIAEVLPVMLAGRRQLVAALAVAPTAALVGVKAKGLQVRSLCQGTE